jgi:hypothetical protein
MKRNFLFVVALFLLLTPALSFAQEQAGAWKPREGDFWHFSAKEWDFFGDAASSALAGIYEVVFAEGKWKISFVAGEKREEVDYSSYQAGLLFSLLGRSKTYQDLRFPFSLGDKWKYDYKSRARGGNKSIPRTVEVQVSGLEEITTAAGKFRVFKLEKDDRAGPRDFWVTTMFYSPETKSVVKSLYDATSGLGVGGKREVELIKYGSTR